jgi:hypothetical protein
VALVLDTGFCIAKTAREHTVARWHLLRCMSPKLALSRHADCAG